VVGGGPRPGPEHVSRAESEDEGDLAGHVCLLSLMEVLVRVITIPVAIRADCREDLPSAA